MLASRVMKARTILENRIKLLESMGVLLEEKYDPWVMDSLYGLRLTLDTLGKAVVVSNNNISAGIPKSMYKDFFAEVEAVCKLVIGD